MILHFSVIYFYLWAAGTHLLPTIKENSLNIFCKRPLLLFPSPFSHPFSLIADHPLHLHFWVSSALQSLLCTVFVPQHPQTPPRFFLHRAQPPLPKDKLHSLKIPKASPAFTKIKIHIYHGPFCHIIPISVKTSLALSTSLCHLHNPRQDLRHTWLGIREED